jgi:CRP/FNR family cyclic AMP-dependent transcriptional regulator
MKLEALVKSEPQLEKLLLNMPEEIRQKVSLKQIGAGETLVKKGEKVQQVYILIQGEVKVANEFSNGRLYTYAHVQAVSFLGELEILAGAADFASTVEAVTACRVLQISAENFTKWLECDHSVLLAITKVLAKKMYPTSRENGTVIFLPGVRKLQAYITKYCSEKEQGGEAFLLDRKRQQIADELGISVKTVNRCVEKLKEEGFLQVKRGKIYITQEQYAQLQVMMKELE